MSRDRTVAALLGLVSVAVFLIDIFLVPNAVLPAAAYAVPIFIAAWALPPRHVATLSVWSGALEVAAAAIQPPVFWLFAIYLVGIVIFGALGTALSSRIRREAALARDAVAHAYELEEANRREREMTTRAEATASRLSAIQHVTEATLSHLEPDHLLEEVTRRLREVFGVDVVTTLLLSEDGQELVVRASSGIGPEITVGTRVALGSDVAGTVAATREPRIVGDLSWTDLSLGSTQSSLRSIMAAPLLVKDAVIGVVCAGSRSPGRFIEGDLVLLQLVADRVALGLENARLYQQAQFERERWQVTVESMLDPVTVSDADGHAIYMNAAYSSLVGMAIEPGLSVAEHPAHYQLHRPDGSLYEPNELPLQQAALRNTELRDVEVIQTTSEGDQRICLWNASPMRGRNGEVVGAVAVGRDVTSQRRVKAERERLLAELEGTFAHMSDGVLLYDASGDIVRMNPAAQAILNYTPENHRLPLEERAANLALQTPDGRAFAPEEAPPARALRGETVANVIMVLRRPDGVTWASVSAAPIRSPEGKLLGAVATFTDVTSRHNMEEQRDDLVRALSHDLRAPLTAILGRAQLLERALRKKEADARAADNIQAIIVAAARMNAMIKDLGDTTTLEAGHLPVEKQQVRLSSFVADVLDRSAGVLDTSRVVAQVPDAIAPVPADPNHLERILTNLVGNGLKYSDPPLPVTVSAQQLASEVVVSVVDQGTGIDEDEIPHLFDRYYRARSARKSEGLGLGLYIVKGLVEAHGGRIWVASSPGSGSTFTFSLPLSGQ